MSKYAPTSPVRCIRLDDKYAAYCLKVKGESFFQIVFR